MNHDPQGRTRPNRVQRSPQLLMQGLVVGLILFLVIFALLVIVLRPFSALPGGAGAVTLSPSQTAHVRNTLAALATRAATATAQVPVLLPTRTSLPTLPPFGEGVAGFLPFADDVNPLTGLAVADPSRLERRPIIVKVSNYPRTGRPHAGLSFADIVFEYYIGYGLNRFAAVYLGQDCPQVGPVRSARLVDAQLGELYQSLLFYGNADPTIDDVILQELGPRALAEKDITSPPKYRIGKVAETSLFVNTAELTDYVNEQIEVSNERRDLRGMIFSDHIAVGAVDGTQLGVQFWTTTRGEWRYDAATARYLRWIEDPISDTTIEMIPLVDRLTEQQISFANVAILYTTYVEIAPTKHEIQLYGNTGGKRAIFFRDGKMQEGYWRVTDHGHPIQFYDAFGAPYHLKPGNTWMVFTGDNSSYAETSAGVWELRFDLP